MLRITSKGRQGLGVSRGGRGITRGNGEFVVPLDPLAAHVAAMQGVDAGGRYFLADPGHYDASLTQAGVFSDAFGSSHAYTAPNVQASPTAVQDPASGLWYVSSDGADDIAVGSAPETCAAYTAVLRSPPGQETWSNYGAPLGVYAYDDDQRRGFLEAGGTGWYSGLGGYYGPQSARRNGVDLTGAGSMAPLTQWMTVTVYCRQPTISGTLAMCAEGANLGRMLRLHHAALRTWPTAPGASVVQQTEQEMARFFAPLLANTP